MEPEPELQSRAGQSKREHFPEEAQWQQKSEQDEADSAKRVLPINRRRRAARRPQIGEHRRGFERTNPICLTAENVTELPMHFL